MERADYADGAAGRLLTRRIEALDLGVVAAGARDDEASKFITPFANFPRRGG